MRTTVVLVALQGLSNAEAAVVQKCSRGTIAWRLHEARQRIQRALEDADKRSSIARRTAETSAGSSIGEFAVARGDALQRAHVIGALELGELEAVRRAHDDDAVALLR